MTTQTPDTCVYDGQKWAIERWDGDRTAIPSNEQFGIETTTKSTANWAGRIDHFLVYRDQLYLLKVEVNLAEMSRHVLPKGAQREVLCRYETMQVFDKDGERDEVREHRFEYFVFHNLPVPYTGDLYLSYPCTDLWELPYAADDYDEEAIRQILSFQEGRLIDG